MYPATSPLSLGSQIRLMALSVATAASDFAGDGENVSFVVTQALGDAKNAVAGDWDADLTLAGSGDAKIKQTLGAATVAGVVSGAAWQVTGAVGAVTAARLIDSSIRVGVDPAVVGLPAQAADFDQADALSSIKSLTLKGVKGSAGDDFVNSIVAAKTWNANEMAYWKKLIEDVKVERPE